MFARLARRKGLSGSKGTGHARGCSTIGLAGVSDVMPLDAIAGEYEMPDVESFEAKMMQKVEGLIQAGALDAGNGEALDARIDMELERVCARFGRQHAENAVMLDRIEASLQARLREIEVRQDDVTERLSGARDQAQKMREHVGTAGRARTATADSSASASPTVVRIAPRIEDEPIQDMREASNA